MAAVFFFVYTEIYANTTILRHRPHHPRRFEKSPCLQSEGPFDLEQPHAARTERVGLLGDIAEEDGNS